MTNLKKIIASLVLLAGLGHLYLVFAFSNPSMFSNMIGGGMFYLILGVLIIFNKKWAILLASLLMTFAGMSAVININQFGYPVNIMWGFVVVDIVTVSLAGIYFSKSRRLIKN